MNVVISHSWSRNMGDAAILRSIVAMLKGIQPGCSIHALVSHPEFSRPRMEGLNAELDGWIWPVPKKERASLIELVSYPFVFAGNFLSALVYRISGKKIFIFNRAHASPLSRMFEADIVISPGGDFLGPHYFFATTLGEFLLAKLLGKRLVICAQTIGPFQGFLNGFITSRILMLADLIIVREKVTLDALSRHGVRNVYLTTDVVFSLPRIQKKQRAAGKVVICPKRLRNGNENYGKRIAELTARIRDELKLKVVYLPTDLYDSSFQAHIAGMAGGEVEVIGEVHPPEEIARMIADSDFIVSSRMHAIILGALSATPFFAIGDSHKFESILGPLCRGCTMSHGELDSQGIGRIMDAIKRRKELERSMDSGLETLQKESMKNLAILEEKFAEWGMDA